MKKIYFGLIALFIGCLSYGQIISQYVETNSGTTPKGIEIWNNTASTLDFSINNLVIEKGTNGGSPSADFTLSTGTLAAGDVIVIGTSDMETVTLANGSAWFLKAFTYNGDDALVVKYGGTITDMFGTAGSDPGSAWSGSGVSTANQNIELNSGITTGQPSGFTDPSTRFSTVNSNPSGVNGDEGFGIAPMAPSSNDTDTEILAPSSGQVTPATITAANTTTAMDAEAVFRFNIEDQGTADGLPTNVTRLRVVPGPNNTADWTDHIQGITLFDVTNTVDLTSNTTVTINDLEIIIDYGPPLVIIDNSFLELEIGIFLNLTDILDGSVVQMEIPAIGSGFLADPGGSTFLEPQPGTVTGPQMPIDVIGTDLSFNQQPTNTEINLAIDPAVTVNPVDINGNIDFDYANTIDLTATGVTFSGTATTSVLPVGGVATFDNLLFNTSGVGDLFASAAGLNDSPLSNMFGVAPQTSPIWCETFTDNSQYAVTTGGEGNDGVMDYFQITDGTNINISYSGQNGNFFAGQDIDDGGWAGSTSPSVLTWTGINISDYTNLKFKGKFASDATGTIDAADNILVEYRTNGVDPWISFLAFENQGGSNNFFSEDTDFSGDGDGTQLTSTFQEFSKLLLTNPTDTTIDIRITVRVNAGGEDIAFEDFKIEGIGTQYPGNAATGFDGPLGTGNFEINLNSTIDFTFNRGTGGALGLFNDYIVVYIDSQPGGITSTTNLTDAGDDGRRAISGFDGGALRSVVNFPPGFEPDFAISMNNGFAGLFEIVEGGPHNFIQSANLAPTGVNNAASYTFDIDYASINTLAGGESFKFLATYLNAAAAFRSDESIGDNTAVGNPGANPIDFLTYYQVSSRKKGGFAPSQNSGLWSTSDTWVNGNAPFEGDVVIINNDVTLNVDYNSSNNLGTDSIEITGANTLTINSASTLEMADGIIGTGNLVVDGNLIITEGGFTDVVPTYSIGSTLEYKDIAATYNRFNEWNLGATVGAGVPDNVIIDNSDLDLSNPTGSTTDEDFSVGTDLTLVNSANLNIDPTKSLTVGGDLSLTGSTTVMNSTSQRYSSLIVNGSATGDVTYNRHVNGNTSLGDTNAIGDNDLISAPVSGQTFGDFATANTNLLENPGDATEKAFAIFDKTTGTYENYFTTTNAATTLDAGVGYRAATNNTSTLAFTGAVNTGTVSYNIINSGPAFEDWNLIGNPYPSYLNVQGFLSHEVDTGVENKDLFQPDTAAIYGYDGDVDGFTGYTIYNLANTTSTTVIAPGQGFLVSSDPTDVSAYDVEFTPTMRATGTTDDFIVGRGTGALINLELQLTTASDAAVTDFYFNENASLGLDPGYDAAFFGGSVPAFAIYSHLVEDNVGTPFVIQTLGDMDFGDTTVALGVNANQGEQLTFSIATNTLPSTVEVYLDDTVDNTSTLLTSGDYVITPITSLNGTGRFYLRFADSALSTAEHNFDDLSIYTDQNNRTIIISGQLLDDTIANVYDIQGRLVIKQQLSMNSRLQTIDASALNTGVYIVKLSDGNQNRTEKIILK